MSNSVFVDELGSGSQRTFKTASTGAATGTSQLYTNTASKTMYVRSLAFSAYNSATGSAMLLNITDATTGTASTVLHSVLLPPASASSIPSFAQALALPVALPASYGLRIVMVSGTGAFSCSVAGYEV